MTKLVQLFALGYYEVPKMDPFSIYGNNKIRGGFIFVTLWFSFVKSYIGNILLEEENSMEKKRADSF